MNKKYGFIFLVGFLFSSSALFSERYVTHQLERILGDLKPYKFKDPASNHEGDLYGHSLWSFYAAHRLLENNEPYLKDLNLTEREKDLFVLAALLHDVGKAGRIELISHAHPCLSYTIVKNEEGVESIFYTVDCQEHTVVGFEYLMAPFLSPKSLPYFGRAYVMCDNSLFDFKAMFKELGLTAEEQKLVGVLVGMHWDFARIGLGRMTQAEFLQKITSLCKACNASFPVDKKLVRLCVGLQVADVFAMAYQEPCESRLGLECCDVPRVHSVLIDIPCKYGYKALPEKFDCIPAHAIFQDLMAYCDTVFESPKVASNLLAGIKQLTNKVELHLHLGGSWPLSYLQTVATPQQFEDLSRSLEKFNEAVDYHQGFHVFDLVGKIINTNQKVEDGTAALCEELKADGVSYVEIRTGLKDFGSGFAGYLESVLKGIKRGSADGKINVGVVLSLRRNSSVKDAEQTIELALANRCRGVVGLDISGDSVNGDGKHFMELLVAAQIKGLPLTLHIGESKRETAEQQMLELTTLNPQRIGHGVHLCNEAQEWIFAHKTPFEMCPSSAVKVRMIEKVADHPGIELLKKGHPVVICTDDPLIFATTLSQELYLVAKECRLSIQDIEALQNKALEYRFKAG